ncbi:hypothetical protein [Quatrionicoccus australiensis]|uniref:hypothetical protein n=1 Tax=Quatrionicoccus australiensis TaxID=138118 RepID=UPI001CFA2F0A|nr:hypothetical protein [Quatrionicoccus australiensis]MCB4361903.1 hypothetical protein [Quatrionicoccus australiensis]
MEAKTQCLVLGAKFFKGEIEGQHHDMTKLFVAMPVSEKDTASYGKAGHDAIDLKFGTSEEYQKLKSLPFPIMAELGLKLTTDGYEVLSFRAISQQPKAA